MEVADLLPVLEQLDDDIDDLEETLAPILQRGIAESSKNLPVLDKAKLHIWLTYALESVIFSYLRLHGVNAKDHRVFREITRVKQYFGKIDALEKEPEQRSMSLDKEAAGRFIKHGLAGNDKIDMERKEQQAKEKARAELKASILAKKAEKSEQSFKEPSGPDANSDSDSDDGASDNEETTAVESTPAEPSKAPRPIKKEKRKDKNKKRHQKKQGQEERRKTNASRRQNKKESRKAMQAKRGNANPVIG